MSVTPILELAAVTRNFMVGDGLFGKKRPLRAVDDVSLRLHKGEVLGLVGESGSGKSTLSRIMLGLDRPTSGDVMIDGLPIESLNRMALARRIQPIFQDPYSSLNPRHTVGDIIAQPLKIHRLGGPAQWRAEAERMLDIVGLPRRVYGNYASQMSGGQRQRVAIARALIMRPSVVICDEPTSALDVSVQSQILNLLMDLRREFELTYLLITHNLAVVEHIASRVAVMYLGRIIETSDTDTMFSRPRHPYTRALLDSVLTPEPGLGLPDVFQNTQQPDPTRARAGCSFFARCARALPICAEMPPCLQQDETGQVECHLEADG